MQLNRAAIGGLVGLFASMPANADGWLNFQGQTGLLDVPDAGIIEPAEVVFHGNNEFVSEGRELDRALNYVFGFSPISNLELSGRVLVNYAESGARIRNDLSGNVKLRVLNTRYFDLAVGAQDFAGDAQQVEGRYGVGTAHLGPLDLTLGYGDGPQRLQSEFGGAALRVGRWGRVVADYDGEHVRAGIGLRLRLADRALVSFSTKLFSEDDNEDISFGLSLRYAFGKTPEPIGLAQSKPSPRPAPAAASAGVAAAKVANRLRDAGLSRVRVGEDGQGRNILKFENRRFWHSHLDGYQVVRNILRETAEPSDGWVLFEEKNGIPRSAALLDEDLDGQRVAWGTDALDDVNWLTEEKGPPLGFELRLEPVVSTFVATDFGILEYDLALLSTARLLLGHGLSLHGAAVVEGTRSEDFRSGGPLADQRFDGGLDEAFVQWTHRPVSAYLGRVSAGVQRFGVDNFSALDYEGLLHSSTGRHQLHAHLARYENLDRDSQSPSELYLGSYRFWWWEQDLSLTFSYGQFFGEDIGSRVILRRYIGNFVVGLFYRRDEDGRQFGGLSISLPLTPRVGQKPWHGAYVVGQPRALYSIGTVIDGPGGRNVLRPNFLAEPAPNYNLRRDFLDSDRAVPGYTRTHWPARVDGD